MGSDVACAARNAGRLSLLSHSLAKKMHFTSR
jgi:hypothetical protein